ncbi:MAG: PrpF family protein [Betaproteobacteria bacterium]|nr:PrpF family protein [Betaproteobacteria bacterium]
MRQIKIPAAFIRGGTSNAIVFDEKNLPRDRALWDEIFLAAIGSPDPYGRQLDGMGGGLSSLSKVCVVGRSSRPDADVDYTFAQVLIKNAKVDYTTMCGNMSSAIGPFAVDEGLVKVAGNEALVRIYSTNTGKLIHARFPVEDGLAVVEGDLAIPGVAGAGAPVKLEFRAPGGATTGKLLPAGDVAGTLDVAGVGRIRCSMVDAANACVFVKAADVGLKGTEMPEELERNVEAMKKLGAIRLAASVAMGISKNTDEAAKKPSVPFIGFVSTPQDSSSLSGNAIKADHVDITGRMLSNGQPHRALPLTCTVCMAVAARIKGSIVHDVTRETHNPEGDLRIAMPSGVLTVGATVRLIDGQWHSEQGAVYRTQRRMFEGSVLVRASRVPGLRAAGSEKLRAA